MRIGAGAQSKGQISPTEANRRKAKRAALITQVESRATRATSLGRTENISVDGMLVLSRDTFEPETEVTVRVNLPPVPPGRLIEARGVVMHAQPGLQMGIQFLDLKDEDHEAIADYVRQASPS